jgi:hypothetical protein
MGGLILAERNAIQRQARSDQLAKRMMTLMSTVNSSDTSSETIKQPGAHPYTRTRPPT